MRFKRFACVAGAVALSAFSLAPLSSTAASADYVGGIVGVPALDGYANVFGGYTFSYVNFFERENGRSPVLSVDIPRYYGTDGYFDGVFGQHHIGVEGYDTLAIVNVMDNSESGLNMVITLDDFTYGFGNGSGYGTFPYPYAYITSTPDTVSSFMNVFNCVIDVQSTFNNTAQDILYEVRYSLDVRARDNSGWEVFAGSVYPFISDYYHGTTFELGNWLYNDLGNNFLGGVNPGSTDVPYYYQHDVEKYFTTTKGSDHTDNGTPVDIYIPTCFYGRLVIEFFSTYDVGGNINDKVHFLISSSSPAVEYSSIVREINYYYSSTLLYDTVGDAFGSILDIPRVFFSTDIVLGFSFGDLILIALAVFVFGLGLKIALGG